MSFTVLVRYETLPIEDIFFHFFLLLSYRILYRNEWGLTGGCASSQQGLQLVGLPLHDRMDLLVSKLTPARILECLHL